CLRMANVTCADALAVPPRRSSGLGGGNGGDGGGGGAQALAEKIRGGLVSGDNAALQQLTCSNATEMVHEAIEHSYEFGEVRINRSEEHTSELQSRENLGCRLLLEK